MDLKSEGKERKRNVDLISSPKEENWEEEDAATSSLPTKRSKKEMTRKPNPGSVLNCGLLEEEEKPKVVEGEGMKKEKISDIDAKLGNALDLDKKQKKKKKRKRGEIEKEYEEKKFGAVREEGEEKKKNHVGEKRKKLDDSTELMVSKEGFDDENKLLRTVFVGNLPLKVKKRTILKEFNNFGEVESVRIRTVPVIDAKKMRKGAIMQKQINEKASSVHAYVVFKTEQSVEASLAANMTLIGGNHIRVDRACPPRKKLKGQTAPFYDPRRTVFVGNLPFDVTDEEIYQLFTSISDTESSVEGIRLVRDPHLNVGKGIAYVLFKTREMANLVIRKGSLKLGDRELRLSPTKCDLTPTKRKNPFCASNPNSPAKKPATGEISSSGAEERTPLEQKSASLLNQGIQETRSVSNKKRVRQKTTIERKNKRPPVAARKAKANPNESGLEVAGNKRKLDNMSPGTFCQNKKLKQY